MDFMGGALVKPFERRDADTQQYRAAAIRDIEKLLQPSLFLMAM
jgi:hypothetical protein